MENKKIICKDCGQPFIFTIEGQKHFTENEFAEPLSCNQCLNLKRVHSNLEPHDMSQFITDSAYWTPEKVMEYGINLQTEESLKRRACDAGWNGIEHSPVRRGR
jgi:hypothetical protein